MNTFTHGAERPGNRNTKRVLLGVTLLIMILAMSACGGSASETAEVPTQDSPAVAVEPTQESAEPVATEVIAPTEVPSTDVPPTAVEPTNEPTTESSEVTLPEGLCANPYFPVVEGAKYTYQSESASLGPSTSAFVFSNVTPSSFDMDLIVDDDSFITYTWQCFEDGLLSPSAQFNNGLDMTVELVESSGITFPTSGNIKVGETWTTHYVLNATMPDSGAGAMNIDETMDLVNEIVAIEPVSTPYGDFDDAVKVQTTGTINMISSMGDTELPAMIINMSSNTWYVKDVGRVRSEEMTDLFAADDSEPFVSELISIE